MKTNEINKPLWIENYNKSVRDWETIWAMDPYQYWDHNSNPGGKAQNLLRMALTARYADYLSDIASRFLVRAIETIDRAFSENKFQDEKCKSNFPFNRGEALRLKNYADGLLNGKFTPKELAQSAEDYLTFCKDFPRMDVQLQAYYLNAVRLYLIIGEQEAAQNLLKKKKPFKWHNKEFMILRVLSNAKTLPIPDNAALANFDEWFDVVRSPKFKPETFMEVFLVRFELGLLRYRYFMSTPSDPIDWETIIEVISR